MKKLKKIIAGVAAVVVVVFVALIVLANVLITPERVRGVLLPLAEEKLGRKVDLGDVEVSLFSGIQVGGLTLYEKGSEEIFVSTDMLRLKYQLLPLLAMKVVIDEVRLENPQIRVVRLADGRFNFSDLTGEGSSKEAQSEPQPSSGESSKISLLVSSVSVTGGELTFLDHALNDKTPYRYQVTALNVAANGVSLTGKLPVDVSCLLNGSPLSVRGEVSLLPFGGDFNVDLQSLDVIAFKPYLKDALPGKLGSLKLNINADVAGNAEDISLNGKLNLAELDFVPDAMPEAALKGASVAIDYDLNFKNKDDVLSLKRLSVDFNGINVNSSGSIAAVTKAPSLDLDVDVPNLQIREALHAIPKTLVGDIGSLDPAGAVSAKAKVAGPVSAALGVLKSATVTLDKVQATAGGYRPALSGRLSLAGDQLTSEGLSVLLGDNKADISLKAEKLFAKTIVVSADVNSERFDLDPLLKGGAGSAVATDQSGALQGGKSVNEEIGPFDLPLRASGTVKVGVAAWKGLSIKDFLARYELKDNVLTLSQMDGQVAGGSFSNTAQVDLGKKGLTYNANLGIKAIQADPLLTALSPKAAGSLAGAMDMVLSLSGRGTQWQTLSKKLNGQGDLSLSDGRVISPGLVKGLAGFLQLPNMNEIAFSNFKGNVKIVDGQVKLDSSMTSKELKLYPKGDIGLDGLLNLSLDTRLSPQVASRLDSRGEITKYMTDEQGWSQVPLLVTGNFSSPRFGLDPKGVKSQAKKAIADKLGKELNKFLGGSSTQQETEGGAGDQNTNPAGQLLQKLFGN